MPFSAYARKATLDWLLGGAAATRPTTRFVGLSFGTPTSVSGSEGSWSGYARQAFAAGAAASPAGSASNTTAVTFTASAAVTASAIKGFQIWDTNLGTNSGNMLYYGTLSTSQTMVSGDSLSFAI